MTAWRWLVTLLSTVAVLWFLWRDVQHGETGPGPLHPAHAALPELQGGAHCTACHREGAGLDVGGCTRCHAAIGEQRTEQRGLHGTLPAELRERCERCHSEHHGDHVALIAPHAFARAGVADVAAYDHRHVAGFALGGVHRTLACTRCHADAERVEPPVGGRYLGLAQRCTACHDDVHRGDYGADCARCHGQEQPWRSVPQFVHVRFPLQGAHAQVACVGCHTDDSPHGVEALLATPGVPTRGCAECHRDVHAAAAPGALHFAATTDCARCHPVTAWRAARPTDEQHAEFGVPLRGPHGGDRCAACHGDAARPARWQGDPAPAIAACARCHASPHATAFVAAAVRVQGPGDGCAGCHDDADAAWSAGRLTHEQHRAAGMALAAPHAEVACASCHRGAERGERFPGRSASECRQCHTDVHRGQFAHLPDGGRCDVCHPGAHWTPSSFGPAAHAATAFPLAGAHAAVACAGCHRQGADGVRAFHGLSTACRDCHADVHHGVFDRPGRPQQVDGRRDCARCHDVAAFAPAQPFAHATWTGYELVGAHRSLGCAQCHRARPGEVIGKVAGKTCAACHTDPHQAQFGAPGTVDCRRCHDAVTWRDVHVDHARTKFPLDATHAAVACSRCHTTYASEAGPVVRYVPLGTRCGDCHRLPAEARK